MARLGQTVTHLLLAGESFTIVGNMGVYSVSVEGTSSAAVTLTGAATISVEGLTIGGGAIPINEDSSPVTIVSRGAENLDGITVTAGTGTANIIMQK